MTDSTQNPLSLAGQVALVTGGGTGIGLGIAKVFATQGATVVISGRREDVLQKAVAELGPQVHYRVHDVTDYAQSEPLISSIEAEHGPLTTLVNNAGNLVKKATEDLTEEELLSVLDVHLVGAFSLSKYAARRMMEHGSGNIIFTASMASLLGIPYVAAYAAAKSAHLGMIRTMSTEWASKGIRINAVAPGWILTDLSRSSLDTDPERKRKILSRTPMHCFGDPEDIGWAVAFLASPAAKFITGVCLPVDGGASIGF